MFKAFGVDRAQPTIRWTGEEDGDVVESTGTVGYKSGGSTRYGAGGKGGISEATMGAGPNADMSATSIDSSAASRA